jgi:hypothetical protein
MVELERRACAVPPVAVGAFLLAPAGLYDGPEDARLAARGKPVKRRGPASTLIMP